MNRREFITTPVVATSPSAVSSLAMGAAPKSVFQQRDNYLWVMWMPTFGLAVSREILDDAAATRSFAGPPARSSTPGDGDWVLVLTGGL